MLVSIIIDSARGLIIDTVSAENEDTAIKMILAKHQLCKSQVNQLCITEVQLGIDN